ncbi:CBS domain-containing protein [Streptomyces sp. NPDC047081]|uniref:CBS domain-containing protein n=1 Tax=Streptomyces sp. NPDC047081 TaxID=3154706 RepID=UPI0033E4D9B5
MTDREARQATAASVEARHAMPTTARKPTEDFRQNMMVRYLRAMASHDAQAAATEPPPAGQPSSGHARHAGTRPATVADLQVSHITKRSAAGVPPDTPFVDVARRLAREQTGALPVVDASDRVVGVVAESDLLARAAALASAEERTGTLSKLLGRRQRPGDDEGTAATLMSAPALTVHPWTPVVEAARTAARSRIRQVYVTDHKDRLVGVVSRSELLHALVRDDAAIRAEIVSHVLRDELAIAPERVHVQVRNGVVTLTGPLAADLVPRLTEAVARIPDVLDVVDHLRAV